MLDFSSAGLLMFLDAALKFIQKMEKPTSYKVRFSQCLRKKEK